MRHYLAGGAEDTCQQVNFTYDSNGVGGFNYLSGRLATRSYSVCLAPNGTSSGAVRTDFTEMFSYTQAGQVAVKRLRVARAIYLSGVYQTTVQRDLDGSWAYDNEGKMTSVTYPVGSGGPTAGTYTFGYDSAGRPTTMNDSSAGVITGVTYGPAGELLTMTGPGYSESRSYNSRLQLTALNGVTFTHPAANNGKIASQSDSVSGETITYQYDSLNRLISAVSNGTWGQTYGYDGFGNLTAKTPAAGKTSATYSAAFSNNREVGLAYDANGNQISDMANYGSLQYDVENRLSWGQKGVASNGSGYGYDPSNKRVYTSQWTYSSQWNVSTEEITYWGIGGQKMGTYGLSASSSGMLLTATGYNVYFGSNLVRKVDSLGTATSVQPDRVGSFGKYAPYGEERTASADNTEKFATYYRDGNTGLDYAVNRYYDSANGRFLSPDPISRSCMCNPQGGGGWNAYSYVEGDPVRFNDPKGLLTSDPDAPDQTSWFTQNVPTVLAMLSSGSAGADALRVWEVALGLVTPDANGTFGALTLDNLNWDNLTTYLDQDPASFEGFIDRLTAAAASTSTVGAAITITIGGGTLTTIGAAAAVFLNVIFMTGDHPAGWDPANAVKCDRQMQGDIKECKRPYPYDALDKQNRSSYLACANHALVRYALCMKNRDVPDLQP